MRKKDQEPWFLGKGLPQTFVDFIYSVGLISEKLSLDEMQAAKEMAGQVIFQINDKIIAGELVTSLTTLQKDFFAKLEMIFKSSEKIRHQARYTSDKKDTYRLSILKKLATKSGGLETRPIAVKRLSIDYDAIASLPIRIMAKADINHELFEGRVATDIMLFTRPLSPENFDELMRPQIETLSKGEVFPNGLKSDVNYFPWGEVIVEGKTMYAWAAVYSRQEIDAPPPQLVLERDIVASNLRSVSHSS